VAALYSLPLSPLQAMEQAYRQEGWAAYVDDVLSSTAAPHAKGAGVSVNDVLVLSHVLQVSPWTWSRWVGSF
jgi:hypothetical protein